MASQRSKFSDDRRTGFKGLSFSIKFIEEKQRRYPVFLFHCVYLEGEKECRTGNLDLKHSVSTTILGKLFPNWPSNFCFFVYILEVEYGASLKRLDRKLYV